GESEKDQTFAKFAKDFAHLSNILTCYPHSITHAGNQPEEVIVLNYKNITWKHHIASTESYSCWEERIF
ncbi:hypothetical protein AB9C34_22680, partial [Escherichia coli]